MSWVISAANIPQGLSKDFLIDSRVGDAIALDSTIILHITKYLVYKSNYALRLQFLLVGFSVYYITITNLQFKCITIIYYDFQWLNSSAQPVLIIDLEFFSLNICHTLL